jgi:hypothetical protein
MKYKINFDCIRDYFLTIKDLYEICDSDETFDLIFKQNYYCGENLTVKDDSRMAINSIEDLSIIIKYKYCIELVDINIHTPFINAPKIAGNICRDIILGDFKFKTMTNKQKEMFVKTTHVDFSNLEMFDIRELCDPDFIKNKTKIFY